MHLESSFTPTVDGQQSSFLGEEDSRRPADSITGASDDGNLSSEARHQSRVSLCPSRPSSYSPFVSRTHATGEHEKHATHTLSAKIIPP